MQGFYCQCNNSDTNLAKHPAGQLAKSKLHARSMRTYTSAASIPPRRQFVRSRLQKPKHRMWHARRRQRHRNLKQDRQMVLDSNANPSHSLQQTIQTDGAHRERAYGAFKTQLGSQHHPAPILPLVLRPSQLRNFPRAGWPVQCTYAQGTVNGAYVWPDMSICYPSTNRG
jgi:hypothetical protein